MRICVNLFEPKFALFYSKMNCAGPVEAVFEYVMDKALQFYTTELKHVSQWPRNSTVDLLVIAFSPNMGLFLLKSLRVDLVLVKNAMVASC